MSRWQFWPSSTEGAEWLQNPSVLHASVVYATEDSNGKEYTRRLAVVTETWLRRELGKFQESPQASNLVMPAMIVLRDGSADELERDLHRTMANAGKLLDSISVLHSEGAAS